MEVGVNLENELARMSSSDLQFTRPLDLPFVRQAKQQNESENDIMAGVTENIWSLESHDMQLSLFRPQDLELLRTDGMKGVMSFNSTLFDQSTAVMMFECFENLLVMAVENPHKVVWDLPMLTQPEKQRQLVEWNKTSAPCPRPGWLLHEVFQDQAKANPDSSSD